MESTCTILGNLFNDPTFKVEVKLKHESMDEEESREMSVRDPGTVSSMVWVNPKIKFMKCQSTSNVKDKGKERTTPKVAPPLFSL